MVRVADGETCASPASKYVWLEAATAPEVEGPRIATTRLSATNFCASDCAGAGPCSTGVSPGTSVIFSPYLGARVLTAYFAQLSCSLPRKAGVTNAIFIGLLQLIACDAEADCVLLGLANAAAAAASASAAAPTGRMSLNLRMQTPCGGIGRW